MEGVDGGGVTGSGDFLVVEDDKGGLYLIGKYGRKCEKSYDRRRGAKQRFGSLSKKLT